MARWRVVSALHFVLPTPTLPPRAREGVSLLPTSPSEKDGITVFPNNLCFQSFSCSNSLELLKAEGVRKSVSCTHPWAKSALPCRAKVRRPGGRPSEGAVVMLLQGHCPGEPVKTVCHRLVWAISWQRDPAPGGFPQRLAGSTFQAHI